MTYNKHIFSPVTAVATLFVGVATAQPLNPAQFMQIEELAKSIANQHNANAQAMVNEMMASTHATASGLNIQFKYVFRFRKGLSTAKLNEFTKEIKQEVVPKTCVVNANNPFFDRGLSYTFVYFNTYGEHLAKFTVDQAVCKQMALMRSKQ